MQLKCSCKKSGVDQSKSSDVAKELEELKAENEKLSETHHKLTLEAKSDRDKLNATESLRKTLVETQSELKAKWKTEKVSSRERFTCRV